MSGMMNARCGVCIEHNLPNNGHSSSFVTPEASHKCLVISVPKYLTQPQLFLDVCMGLIGCSQEYHSDGAQMVVELQMMVDIVVDPSCYQQDISINLSLGDMLAVINK
jgi:hypothetical protein